MRQKLSSSLSFVLIMMAIFASITTLKAQETNANFAGQVTDTKGVALIGTVISIKHIPTGFETKTQSNNKGYFYVPNLPVGGPFVLCRIIKC